MKYNNFYNDIERMMALPNFADDTGMNVNAVLEILRDGIEGW